MNADKQGMCNDNCVLSDYDQFYDGCKIAAIHKGSQTSNLVDRSSTRPGQMLFMDIIPHPYSVSLTQKNVPSILSDYSLQLFSLFGIARATQDGNARYS
jgi:hypothetical protein